MVAAAGSEVDVTALDELVRRHLAGFEVLRYYEVAVELPHTPTGRLATHHLSLDRTPAETDPDNEERHG